MQKPCNARFTAEGDVVKINRSAGTVDIAYTDRVPYCYPFVGGVRVANPDLIGKIREGDRVQFEFRATRLPVKTNDGHVPLRVEEITTLQVIAAPMPQQEFNCPK
jgi:hypothetical protein